MIAKTFSNTQGILLARYKWIYPSRNKRAMHEYTLFFNPRAETTPLHMNISRELAFINMNFPREFAFILRFG